MAILPLSLPPHTGAAPAQALGRLQQRDTDGTCHVACEDGSLRACRVAASCLLQPAPGDLVLVAGTDRHRQYLLAIVEQADAATSHVAVAGDLRLHTGGALTLHAESALRLRAAHEAEITAHSLRVQADEAETCIGSMRHIGRALSATVATLRTVSQTCETLADRLLLTARHAVRSVELTDQARVGHLDVQAAHTARLHAQHTLVTGEALVKVDAAQIHVG